MNMHPQQKLVTLGGWLANASQVARAFAGMLKKTNNWRQNRPAATPEKTIYPWLKSYPPEVDWAAEIPTKPLYALLDDATSLHAAKACVEFCGRHFSYAEIKRLSDRAAKGLTEAGFKPGMKLGLFLPNCPYFVVFYYAGL